MDIFESLENLNVSEECFDDIIGIMEDIVSDINTKVKDPKKKNELLHKAFNAQFKEEQSSREREMKGSPEYEGETITGVIRPFGIEDKYDKRQWDKRYETKNTKGEKKNLERHFKDQDVRKEMGVFGDEVNPSAEDWIKRKKAGRKRKERIDAYKKEMEQLRKNPKKNIFSK